MSIYRHLNSGLMEGVLLSILKKKNYIE